MDGPSTRRLAAIVARQLPGYKLASPHTVVAPGFDSSDTVANMRSEKGPSIEQLRQKFLRDHAADAAAVARNTLGSVDNTVATVLVQPKDGGPAKTADIRNGKIAIVQG